MITRILSRRQKIGKKDKPLFLWEPVPDVCSPDDWEACILAMRMVDVTSPNINEAARFLGQTIDEEQPFSKFKVNVENLAREYIVHFGDHEQRRAAVFRCGRHGCLVATRSMMEWLPAYHQTAEMVVDPTGGGNAFCGGFCAGWVHSHGDLRTAAAYGNIAASFVIEQLGLPRLDYGAESEMWNGDAVDRRLVTYKQICG